MKVTVKPSRERRVTYAEMNTGQVCRLDGSFRHYYMKVQAGPGHTTLISLEDGNRWLDHVNQDEEVTLVDAELVVYRG